jgi:hypothetical protein
LQGLHRIEVRDRRGNISEATLELKFRRIRVLPPIGKQSKYPELELTVLHATERGKPRGRNPIDWQLITNPPVASRAQAIEKLQWYALRWRIEVFHKILKSGCQFEQSTLRTAERPVNLLATFCILSWRIFWLTMINRITKKAKASLAFTPLEIDILKRLVPENQSASSRPPSLQSFLTQLARLGGYLNRAAVRTAVSLIELHRQRRAEQLRKKNTLSCEIFVHAKASRVMDLLAAKRRDRHGQEWGSCNHAFAVDGIRTGNRVTKRSDRCRTVPS